MNGASWVCQAESISDGAARSIIHFPPFRLDAQEERLWRGKQEVALRPKTFAVLRYLLERPGQLIRKAELLDRLWGEVVVSESVLKTYFREIRQALGDSARAPRFIETAHGRGYRFIGRVLSEHEQPRAKSPVEHELRVTPPELAVAFALPEVFIGRQAELASLERSLERALSGQRQVVFITGEPGIGKTSVVHAFLRAVASRRELALGWGQCVEQYGAGEAYLPLLEALRRLARGPERRSLAAVFRRDASSWLSLMPGLLEKSEPNELGRRAIGATPERMLCEMADALEAFTREHPLVLWFEDLHWADPSTVAFLSYLARRSDAARLLLILTHRPLAARAAHPLTAAQAELLSRDRCELLELGFLTRAELDLFFARRFDGHRIASATVDLVHQHTAGSPLFLERVLEAWSQRGWLCQGSQGWELGVPVERALRDVPQNVVSMIEREIELLDAFERSVLEAASAAGVEFSAAAVAAALKEDVVRVEELCLRWARRRQFFRAGAPQERPDGTRATACAFIHALYRQVAYELVGPTRRARLHARIGAHEEQAYGQRARDIASELALHFEHGQEFSKAVRYRLAAGEQALRRGAWREAIAHFRHGLELLPRLCEQAERSRLELELLVALGAPLAMTLGNAAREVEQVYARAHALCLELGARGELFQALMGVGAFYVVRGEFRVAYSLSAQLSLLARQQEDAGATLEAHLLAGTSLLFLGDYAGAERELEQTVALYHRERHGAHIFLFVQDPAVCALSLLPFPLWITGRTQAARARAERALELARALDHPMAIAMAYLGLAQLEQSCGRIAQARAHAEAGFAVAVQHGLLLYQHTLSILVGIGEIEQGERESGLARVCENWRVLNDAGTEFASARWRAFIAEALARCGRTGEAVSILAEAFARVYSHEERWWEPDLYRTLGDLLLAHGDRLDTELVQQAIEQPARDAETCFLRALALAQARGARAFELCAALRLARLWQARGELSRARDVLEAACHGFDPGELEVSAARGLLQRLSAALDAGSPGQDRYELGAQRASLSLR